MNASFHRVFLARLALRLGASEVSVNAFVHARSGASAGYADQTGQYFLHFLLGVRRNRNGETETRPKQPSKSLLSALNRLAVRRRSARLSCYAVLCGDIGSPLQASSPGTRFAAPCYGLLVNVLRSGGLACGRRGRLGGAQGSATERTDPLLVTANGEQSGYHSVVLRLVTLDAHG